MHVHLRRYSYLGATREYIETESVRSTPRPISMQNRANYIDTSQPERAEPREAVARCVP